MRSMSAGSQLSRLPRKCCKHSSGGAWLSALPTRRYTSVAPSTSTGRLRAVSGASSVSVVLMMQFSLLVSLQGSRSDLACAVSRPLARDRVEDDRGVLRRRLLPDEVPGIDDHQTASRQPLV